MNKRAQLIADADAEMLANIDRPVTIETDLQSVMGMVGLVQLACRHPGVDQKIKNAAIPFVDNIGAHLQELGLHGLAAMVRAGWNSDFDEVRPAPHKRNELYPGHLTGHVDP